jgi:hypothetical protein
MQYAYPTVRGDATYLFYTHAPNYHGEHAMFFFHQHRRIPCRISKNRNRKANKVNSTSQPVRTNKTSVRTNNVQTSSRIRVKTSANSHAYLLKAKGRPCAAFSLCSAATMGLATRWDIYAFFMAIWNFYAPLRYT